MRLLLDTDVLLDVALRRKGFFETRAKVLRWAEAEPGQTAVAWHSLSNLACLVRPNARDFIRVHHRGRPGGVDFSNVLSKRSLQVTLLTLFKKCSHPGSSCLRARLGRTD
jgi:hypothetical protein